MESRILYLEKEMNLIRNKFFLLETNIQNELKNYIDEYLSTYLEQVKPQIEGALGSPDNTSQKSELENIKISSVKSKIKLETSAVKEEDEDEDPNNHQSFSSNDEKFENNEIWTDNSPDSDGVVTEYRFVNDDTVKISEIDSMQENIVVELNDVDMELIQNGEYEQTDEGSSEADIVELDEAYTADPTGGPTIRIGSTFVPDTSFYLPTILSTARDKASQKVEAKNPGSPADTPSSSKSKNTTTKGSTAAGWPYQCQVCLEKFKCASHFEKHKIKHFDDRPYSCQFCDKSYKRGHHLKEHQNLSHPNEKEKIVKKARTFRCLRCSKVFTRSTHLAAHSKTHAQEKGIVRYKIEEEDVPVKKSTDTNTPQFHGFNLTL